MNGPTERIQAFVAFAFDYIRTHPARSLFESEPGFVLGYLLAHLPKLQAALLEQLGDAFDTVPAVASGSLSREQLADVIVRLFASSFIIPESDDRALVQSISGMLLPRRQVSDGAVRYVDTPPPADEHMEEDEMDTETPT